MLKIIKLSLFIIILYLIFNLFNNNNEKCTNIHESYGNNDLKYIEKIFLLDYVNSLNIETQKNFLRAKIDFDAKSTNVNIPKNNNHPLGFSIRIRKTNGNHKHKYRCEIYNRFGIITRIKNNGVSNDTNLVVIDKRNLFDIEKVVYDTAFYIFLKDNKSKSYIPQQYIGDIKTNLMVFRQNYKTVYNDNQIHINNFINKKIYEYLESLSECNRKMLLIGQIKFDAKKGWVDKTTSTTDSINNYGIYVNKGFNIRGIQMQNIYRVNILNVIDRKKLTYPNEILDQSNICVHIDKNNTHDTSIEAVNSNNNSFKLTIKKKLNNSTSSGGDIIKVTIYILRSKWYDVYNNVVRK